MNITPGKVLEIQRYAREPLSLDQTIGDEGDSQLGDFIEDSQAVVALDGGDFRPGSTGHPPRCDDRVWVTEADVLNKRGRDGSRLVRDTRRYTTSLTDGSVRTFPSCVTEVGLAGIVEA
jgi:hypothetical protein